MHVIGEHHGYPSRSECEARQLSERTAGKMYIEAKVRDIDAYRPTIELHAKLLQRLKSDR